MRINPSLFLVSFFSLSLTACQPSESQKELHQQQLFAFGTLIDISIVSDNLDQAKQAINEMSSEFDQLHTRWHPWENGVLGQANVHFSKSKTFISDKSVIKLIKDSQLLSEKSNGLFNPAIGQLIKLWQFDQLENEHYQFTVPAPEKIKTIIAQKPQMQDVFIENNQISSNNPNISLDFGAFAKGVAIERMMTILKKHNINNALVNAGGDLKVLGSKNGKPWKIGIKNPQHSQNQSEQAVIAAINLKDNEALFTSGDYERFFELEGKHYHHILDPRTGYPAIGTQSVTILSEDAALADAASTALFIAGPELWPDIAKKMGIEYVMLISNKKIYLTPAMAERIELFTDSKPIILK